MKLAGLLLCLLVPSLSLASQNLHDAQQSLEELGNFLKATEISAQDVNAVLLDAEQLRKQLLTQLAVKSQQELQTALAAQNQEEPQETKLFETRLASLLAWKRLIIFDGQEIARLALDIIAPDRRSYTGWDYAWELADCDPFFGPYFITPEGFPSKDETVGAIVSILEPKLAVYTSQKERLEKAWPLAELAVLWFYQQTQRPFLREALGAYSQQLAAEDCDHEEHGTYVIVETAKSFRELGANPYAQTTLDIMKTAGMVKP